MSIYNNVSMAFSYIPFIFNLIYLKLYEILLTAKNIIFDKNAMETRIQQLFISIFVIFAGVVLYYASIDKEALNSKTYLYFFLSVIPIIFALGYTLPLSNTTNNSLYKTFIIVFILIFFSGAFYYYSSMDIKTATAFSLVVNFLLFLIIAVGMGIFFIIFSNYLKSYTGVQGFIIYLIFYIPCLIVDYFRYLMGEVKSTTNDVYTLFILEILCVLLYVYLPQLIATISNSNGIILLENSVFLDTPFSVDTKLITIKPSDDILSRHTNINYRKNYAISLWTYLNSETLNNNAYSKESLIFSYGHGKPMITYFNDVDVNNDNNNTFLNTDKYVVYFTNAMKNGPVPINKKINLPSQKWNNLVFNYYSDHVDLFVNGNLEVTYAFDDTNRPIYQATDMINIGSKDGLNGAVCNVRYYTEPLSKSKIINLYNLLIYKNPPTFS